MSIELSKVPLGKLCKVSLVYLRILVVLLLIEIQWEKYRNDLKVCISSVNG